MATINQIRANRSNAKKSTGPNTPEGKDKVRFNSLVHGLRAESAVIPGEDQDKFDQHLAQLSAAWMPQDIMEKSLVEQIAVTQWKLARIDRSEARMYAEGAMTPAELVMAIHRVYLTQVRLERSVSTTIADLERYRKERVERQKDLGLNQNNTYRKGILWSLAGADPSYSVLPQIRGLDGVWREIPREVLGDFPNPPASGDKTAPPSPPNRMAAPDVAHVRPSPFGALCYSGNS
jgi:hypothetical protein